MTATGTVVPLSVTDYALAARTLLPSDVWDFIAGGAGRERSLAANETAFDGISLRPRVLAGVDEPDLRVRVLGRDWAAPVGVAPVAYHQMVHPDGEAGTALATGRLGLPFIVSTFASRSFPDIADAAGGAPLWLQLYYQRDIAATAGLIRRAEAAGFEALVLTVDTPRLGRRLRDLRNGFRVPAGVTAVNLATGDAADPAAHSRLAFEPALTWEVVERLRATSPLPVVVKGVLTAEDATAAVAAGVDGIIVSNHGGRQLDRVPSTIDALPEVVGAVAGRVPVFLDGGVRDGADAFIALARGATAVFVGRPVLYGLAVGGDEGVRGVLSMLTDELADTMLFTGRASVAAIDRTAVSGGELTRS